MSTQGTIEGQGGTLMGKAPAARIFALVVLSLVVLLGSLLAVRAIGQHDGSTAASTRSGAEAAAQDAGVLVVPKDEPKPKAAPKAQPKPKTTQQASTTQSAPIQSSAASSSAPAQSSPAPTPTPAPAPAPTPAPVQSAPAPTPTPAPKASAPAAKKPAPVQHTVVVTQ